MKRAGHASQLREAELLKTLTRATERERERERESNRNFRDTREYSGLLFGGCTGGTFARVGYRMQNCSAGARARGS